MGPSSLTLAPHPAKAQGLTHWCVTHSEVMDLLLLTKVSMSFTSISLLSGCWCEADNEEAPSEQIVCVEGVSEVRTPGSCPLIQKAHPCETGDLLLKGILTPG